MQCTFGRMTKIDASMRRVQGHSLVRSLVRSHCSLIRLLRTARYARALRCAHSLAHGKDEYVYKLNASISYHFNPLCGDANSCLLTHLANETNVRAKPSKIVLLQVVVI